MNTITNDLKSGFEILWYKIHSVLGRGGFGITYLATDTNLGQLVAIKEYLPHDYATRSGDSTVQPASVEHDDVYAWGLDRFMSEAKTLAKFRHKNIVRVLSVFKHNNTGYMVMDYEQGQDLSEYYKEQKQLSQSALETIYYPIMEGLKSVHQAGFIHRDIKPANIYIRENGSPVLLDFGAARQAVGTKTKTLTAMLSVGYAPFEQYNDMSGKQGPWTDIYSIGASLYQGITGEKPMESTIRGMALVHREPDPFMPLSQSDYADYSYSFLRAIDQALMLQITDRPQTLEEFLAMLKGELSLDKIPFKKPAEEKTAIRPKNNVFSGRDISKSKGKTEPQNFIEDKPGNHNKKSQTANLSPDSKSHLKTLSIVVSLLALAVIGFFFLSPVQTPEQLKQQQITLLLKNAGKFITAGHYYSTNKDNAFSKFNKVLMIDPANSLAKDGVTKVGNHYLNLAQQFIELNKLSQADSSLKIVSQINADFPGLKKYQGLLSKSIAQEKISRQIGILTKKAKIALTKNHIYEPKKNSALAYFQKILKLEDGNSIAIKEIKEIASVVIIDTKKLLASKKYKKVEKLLNLVESINPENPDIQTIRNQIAYSSKLKSIITKADKAYSKQQYTSPKSNNAFDLYNRVLKISPDNQHATQRLDKIAKYYANKISNSLRTGKIAAAQNTFNIIKSSFPNYPGLKNLKRNIDFKLEEQNASFTKKEQEREKQRTYNSIQYLIPVGINQNQNDSDVVQDIVGGFQLYFQNKDIKGISKVANINAQTVAFYNNLFSLYKELKLKVIPNSFNLTREKGFATVSFQISNLIDSRGNPVETTAVWTKISLKVIKKSDYWLKAEITG